MKFMIVFATIVFSLPLFASVKSYMLSGPADSALEKPIKVKTIGGDAEVITLRLADSSFKTGNNDLIHKINQFTIDDQHLVSFSSEGLFSRTQVNIGELQEDFEFETRIIFYQDYEKVDEEGNIYLLSTQIPSESELVKIIEKNKANLGVGFNFKVSIPKGSTVYIGGSKKSVINLSFDVPKALSVTIIKKN
jgi:hypothetical protein